MLDEVVVLLVLAVHGKGPQSKQMMRVVVLLRKVLT